ncbi:hypothetical protein [Haloarcula sebkhae]|uniref:Uncharacterized protein n=2 Tax=Haloarcula sebkhae TaxID=932660 RepID=A0ACC6VG40_9EURY|nr:hypothetical protein [Haloarcula sebkhae]GGK54392.1 hypothetical protein GCM10009067_03640 [Haloarcula sebkhae]
MGRKHKAGEVVAYLLAVLTGFGLFLTTDRVSISTNAREHTHEYSVMSGIQLKRASVINLVAFTYAVVSIAFVRIPTFLASNGENLLDSLSVGVDERGLTTGLIPEPTPTEVLTLSAAEEGINNIDLNDETQEP